MLKLSNSFKLCAAALVGSLTLSACETLDDTHTKPEKTFFSSFKEQTPGEEWKYVFAGDGSHDYSSAFDLIANPEIMNLFYSDGGRSIFLELPIQLQPNLDALRDDKITLEQFVQTGLTYTDKNQKTQTAEFTSGDKNKKMQAIGSAILEAKKYGISIYAADAGANLPPEIEKYLLIHQEYVRVQKEFNKEFWERNKTRIENGANKEAILAEGNAEILAKYPELTKQDLIAQKAIMNYRSDDHALAKFIKKHAGSHRAMVIFGARHLVEKHPTGLRTLLSSEGLSIFNVYPNDEAVSQAIDSCKHGGPNYIPPVVFLTETNEFVRFDPVALGCPAP